MSAQARTAAFLTIAMFFSSHLSPLCVLERHATRPKRVSFSRQAAQEATRATGRNPCCPRRLLHPRNAPPRNPCCFLHHRNTRRQARKGGRLVATCDHTYLKRVSLLCPPPPFSLSPSSPRRPPSRFLSAPDRKACQLGRASMME